MWVSERASLSRFGARFWIPISVFWGPWGIIFGTFGLIWVTRGCPGSSKGDSLEPEVVFCQFCFMDLWFLSGSTLGSFRLLFRVLWCQRGRLGCGLLFLLFGGGKATRAQGPMLLKHINTMVVVCLHLFRETCFFDSVDYLWEIFWEVCDTLGIDFVVLEGPGNRFEFRCI